MNRRSAASLLLILVWLGIVGAAVWHAAKGSTEPPAYDPMTYAQKASNFWHAVALGKPFNPLDIEPSVRPPGTILMSYPFGFTADFRGYYFRSTFIPLVLLIAAVYIAGYSREAPTATKWRLAFLALILAGMPSLYQFQGNDSLAATNTWGFVDNFLAAVSAVAAAAAMRSVRRRSWQWAAAAAVAAALALMIKPAGALVMAVVGVTWVLLTAARFDWRASAFIEDTRTRRFAAKGLAAAAAIFGLATWAAFSSAYFSPANIAYGNGALVVMKNEVLSALDLHFLTFVTHVSFGYAVPLVIAGGFVAAFWRKGQRTTGAAAALCLVMGGVFWLLMTESSQIRYFLPFGVMAFVILIPALLDLPASTAMCLATAFAVAPTFVVTVLLVEPHPPLAWQQRFGVNLISNFYRAENEQGAQFFESLRQAGTTRATLYTFYPQAPLRNFTASINYPAFIDPRSPAIEMSLPTNWRQASVFRLSDILGEQYIALEPMKDAEKRAATLAPRAVPDYATETAVMTAWFSGLTPADGVDVVSETRVRLLRVTDPLRFETALLHLQLAHDWPASFIDANPQRLWTAAELADAQKSLPVAAAGVDFHFLKADTSGPTIRVHLVSLTSNDDELAASFWLENGNGPPLTGQWFLFAHVVNEAGAVLSDNHVALLGAAPLDQERPIRLYTMAIPKPPPGAAALAFGFYKPDGPTSPFLVTDAGRRDWENRRLWISLK